MLIAYGKHRIFSIGPTLNLNAEAKASVGVEVDLNVDLAYSVTSLKFVFPPSQGGSSVDLSPKDSRKCHLLSRDINIL